MISKNISLNLRACLSGDAFSFDELQMISSLVIGKHLINYLAVVILILIKMETAPKIYIQVLETFNLNGSL